MFFLSFVFLFGAPQKAIFFQRVDVYFILFCKRQQKLLRNSMSAIINAHLQFDNYSNNNNSIVKRWRREKERDEGILIYHFSGCCYRVTKGEPQELKMTMGTSLKLIYSHICAICKLKLNLLLIETINFIEKISLEYISVN